MKNIMQGEEGGQEGAGDPEEWWRLLAGGDALAVPDHHEDGSGSCRKWVGETLMKAFPLGVFRDRKPELPASTRRSAVKTSCRSAGSDATR